MKSPLIKLTMAAAAGYGSQPMMVNANNISGVYPWRRKTGAGPEDIEVLGTYVCTGTHDFMVEESYDDVVGWIRDVVG